MIRYLTISLLLALAQPSDQAVRPSTIILRGGAAPQEGVVVAVDLAGVHLNEGDRVRVISWDRVSRVDGAAASISEPFLPVAHGLWRARIRIEKGDFEGAEPLLEPLIERFNGVCGPTSAVFHASLMRCRMERGAISLALVPWLRLVAAGTEQVGTDSAPLLQFGTLGISLIDPAFGLAPDLPPMFLDLPSTRSLRETPWLKAQDAETAGSRRAAALREMYLAALEFELTGQARPFGTDGHTDAGLTLVRDMVTSRLGGAEARAAARSALLERLKRPQPEWARAWINAAVGRSLLIDTESESQLLGVGKLLEVAATASEGSLYLTGLCLAQSSASLAALGDREGAWRLKQELVRTYPGHPALEWDPVRRIAAPPTATGTIPSPDGEFP
jgi:hypothetical protein